MANSNVLLYQFHGACPALDVTIKLILGKCNHWQVFF